MTDRIDLPLPRLTEEMIRHLTPERWEKIAAVSAERTRYLTVVMENIYYTQNMSAVVRTSDCMGIQDVHIVGRKNSPRINTNVALGAGNWVDVHRDIRRPVTEALEDLKKQGYRLVATLPGDGSRSLYDIDVTAGKIALMFGQEVCGLSEEAVAMADERVTIPMWGFSDSFNISVSAGICLYELKKKLIQSDLEWKLTARELLELRHRWVKSSLKHGDRIEKAYELQLGHPNNQ
jgi:tRNA (guanosine-2'-O-)-methyltransferase